MGIKKQSLTPQIMRFDRREFMKLGGAAAAGAVGSLMISTDHAIGMEKCASIMNVDPNTLDPQASNHLLHYWVDGRHLNDLSNLKSRANLSLFFNLKQTPERFVETVLLVNQDSRTMGARFFDATDKMSSGHLPYVIFENVSLNFDQKYYIYYQVREGTETVLYKFTLENARRSYMNSTFLPQTMLDDFRIFMGDHPGLLTTPYQFYTENGLTNHCARAAIRDIGSDHSFNIDIELMHGDASTSHYMRYFIVADPVGRIIGFVKREYDGDTTAVGPTNKAAMRVNAISPEQVTAWGLSQDYVGLIGDCPYVQFFTEDVFDALARSTIRLR